MADTLSIWRRARFEWGRTDCVLSTSGHILRATGIDPAAQWRGSYSTKEGAEAIYQAHGGLLCMVRLAMAQAGFTECAASYGRPVVASFGDLHVAGLCLGRRVAFMFEGRGCIEIPAKVEAAWIV